jgi:transcriptional regulator
MPPRPTTDLTGRRFGYLTVTGYHRYHSRGFEWECTCDCGRTRNVMKHLLESGRIVRCLNCPDTPAPIPGPVPEGFRESAKYPGYPVDEDGIVLTWRRGRWTPMESRPGSPKRYKRLRLKIGGNKAQAYVHEMILLAFVGPRPPGCTHVRHLNGNPQDNRLSNLCWGTPIENAGDKSTHGTLPKGEGAYQAKLTERDVIEILRLRDEGWPSYQIGRFYGVARTTVLAIIFGRSWAHIPRARKPEVLNRKLTPEDVRTIRKLHVDGTTQVEIARRFGITQANVSAIVRGVNWKHVT